MTTAVAIFVKTPGHSPIKTRLAAAIGVDAAVMFHRLAARAVGEVACAAREHDRELQPYWAVAERGALDDALWSALPTLDQRDGGLGERLHTIYAGLLAHHDRVLLIGADVPQLTPAQLDQACRSLSRPTTPFVMGEAHDGGFWLFGGRRPVAREVWCSVPYSQPDTAARLRRALALPDARARLPRLTDVDHAADLDTLADALAALPAPLAGQRALLQWLRTRREGLPMS